MTNTKERTCGPDYLADLELLESMLTDDFDWEKWWDDPAEEDPGEIFRRVYKWHDYREGNRPRGVVDCGSVKFEDTPRSLYRALFWVAPSFVDFSDMYKTGTLIDLCSPDYDFLCSLQLFKYELGAYFECAEQHKEGRLSMIQGGWPGCDNGVRCKSDLGKKWFGVIVRALTQEWSVYSGNNFSV